MQPLLDAVRGPLNRQDITVEQLYDELRHLKQQCHGAWGWKLPGHFDDDEAAGEIDESPKLNRQDVTVEQLYDELRHLKQQAWGGKLPSHFDDDEAASEIEESPKLKNSSKTIKIDEEEEDEEEDGDSGCPFKFLTYHLRKYWEMKVLGLNQHRIADGVAQRNRSAPGT